MTHFEIETEGAARLAFWRKVGPAYRAAHWRQGQRQNDYPADVRAAWCDWVDNACREQRMAETLAEQVTL